MRNATVAIIVRDGSLDAEVIRADLAAALPGEVVAVDTDLDDVGRSSIEIAVVANPPHGSLHQLPRLRFVQSLWAGVDKLLGDGVPSHVSLSRLVDSTMTRAMTASVTAHVLGIHLRLREFADAQAARHWELSEFVDITQCTVAVLGLGELGLASATALRSLGFNIVGWSRSPRSCPFPTSNGRATLFETLGLADIVVNLLPLTPDTRSVFNTAAFAAMKAGASFVNVGRGAHVDDDALLVALDSGHLHRAVLDVFNIEPLPTDHRYWTHPKVTVLPHVAAYSSTTAATDLTVANIEAFRSGRPIAHPVDLTRGY
jgi:glyoxylate/hydroxypyruvate reductase